MDEVYSPVVTLRKIPQRRVIRGGSAVQQIGFVAAGGAIGAVLRFGVSLAIARAYRGDFPWATLLINVAGCLAIGVLMAVLVKPGSGNEAARLFLVVGVLGGFTTFSSFGYEVVALTMPEKWLDAAGYIVASNALGLGAAFIGFRVADRMM